MSYIIIDGFDFDGVIEGAQNTYIFDGGADYGYTDTGYTDPIDALNFMLSKYRALTQALVAAKDAVQEGKTLALTDTRTAEEIRAEIRKLESVLKYKA